MQTILEAIVLVVLVVILFLQTWRAAIIPIVAIPVSLIGTFFLMAAFGFSLNNLSLFGLVLAIGIVVDDAIVVVENVERNMAKGLSPREAAYRTMEEVGAALIAIALVLTAVFVPSAFITGISGQFYRQFALTIAGATVISLIVSLTLSPGAVRAAAEAARAKHAARPAGNVADACLLPRLQLGLRQALVTATAGSSAASCAFAVLMLVVYAGVIAFGMNEFRKTPDRLHSAARRRLPDHCHAASARRLARPHRRRQPPRRRAGARQRRASLTRSTSSASRAPRARTLRMRARCSSC